MDAGCGRDRGIAWRARNAGAAMPRPAPSVNVADISTNCATEPANFVGRLIAIRSLSRRRVRHRRPAVEADREPQSCRRRAESRRASAANKYSIASMHAPSRTEAHRGGTGPAFGSGLTGPHRLPAVSIREIVIAAVSCRVVSLPLPLPLPRSLATRFPSVRLEPQAPAREAGIECGRRIAGV